MSSRSRSQGILSSGHGTRNILSSGHGTQNAQDPGKSAAAQSQTGDNQFGWGGLMSGFSAASNYMSSAASSLGQDVSSILSSGHGTSGKSGSEDDQNILSSGHGTRNRGWGTGAWAGGSTEQSGQGGFFKSVADQARNNSRSGAGTGHGFRGTGGDREYGSFGSGGAGLGLGPIGAGVGGGGGAWSQDGRDAEGNGRVSQGYGGGAGLVGSARFGDDNFNAGGEVYRGVGGNAYTFEGDGEEGFGLDANYTNLGGQNLEVGSDTFLGDYQARVGDVGVGRAYGGVEGGQRDDGTLFGRASVAPSRTEVRDVELTGSNALGDSSVSMGSFGTGPRHEVETYLNPETGAAGGGYQWAGGGWKAENIRAEQRFSDQERVEATVGTIDTANSWGFNAGWDPEQSAVVADGNYATGNTVEDVNVDVETRYGNANASMGKYSDGNSVNGTARIDENGLNANVSDFGYNNRSVEDVQVGFDAGPISEQASLDRYDSGLRGENIDLDVGPDGVRLAADRIGYNQQSIEGFRSRREIDGIGTSELNLERAAYNTASAEGYETTIDSNGASTRLDRATYAKVAVDNLGGNIDLGDNGRAEANIGHVGVNEATVEGLRSQIGPDGASGSLERAGFQQYGAQDLTANANFFDGAVQLDGSVDNVGVNQASVEGARYNIDENGLEASLDRADYSYAGISGVDVDASVLGYDASMQLDRAAMHDASIENVNYSVDADGTARGSFDNASYDYFGVEGFQSSSGIEGVFGSEVRLGSGSLAGGDIGRFESESNLMEGTSSASVSDASARLLALEDVSTTQSVGQGSVTMGADRFSAVELSVGQADMETADWGTRGNASVEDLQYSLVDAEGLGGSVNWGDRQLASADIDLNAGYSLGSGEADWNLQTGDVTNSFEDARIGGQVGGDFTIGDREFSMPTVGAQANIDGQSNSNLYDASSQGNLNFAGSSIDLGFTSIEAGEDANLGWDVDLNRDIASSNIDITIGDTTYDIDQGIRDGAQAVSDGVSTAADWAGDRVSDAGSAISSGVSSLREGAGNLLSSWGW